MILKPVHALLCASLTLPLLACGATEDDAPAEQDVTLRFAAQVGEEAFACGQSYQGLGTTATTFEPHDFRLYVSEIEVQHASGEWEALALEQDGRWQHENLALLDFEDASGACQNGTAELRDIVVGRAGEGELTGVRLTLGVPFELNHIDAATAPSPLNVTGMFWNWLGGYKFVRIEGATTGLTTGWQFHLGSTECEPAEGGGATACARENRVTVTFEDISLSDDVIVFDLAELVGQTNLDQKTENTPSGCMSGPNDPDCAAIFSVLGLPHGDTTPEGGNFVRLQSN
ncbi:metallo-mystery pair system four-Cys motif protein [Lujinxingia litoralis]|uniref:Metallo-mystery pair system four-Cys motif protein n=1 Tax=Lujinxingia litoralis TaxID=2211119 RepID=A0A328C0T3_9DELT|nr:MbnP family copper-binding protein [Lujinxingia litoralis]RAL20003.1 metallo-mystery pair system four-Cys motif protein [Lujinxingia litoralis]